MEALINIDNGGTLTDICVWDGDAVTFTKTLTTPHDLSECLFSAIEKASTALYGAPDTERLLHSTQHIRYSTTQGTNALVERRGPMIGILTTVDGLAEAMQTSAAERSLFAGLVEERILDVDMARATDDIDFEVVQQVNRLTTLGAARVVVAGRSREEEHRLRHVLLRKFPRHLLGSIPLIYSWELAGDRDDPRRVWSCVLNSFLHPTMERFLYASERRLKSYKVANPLLVYRNDGASSRVAKSVALKTYSSGPRGGLEGTAALARIYGLEHTLMMDIGGTTTDVGVVVGDQVSANARGTIKGVPVSYPMSNVHSKGVGGSSVISVTAGAITVGPDVGGCRPGAGLLRLRWQAGHHHRRQPPSRRPRCGHLPRRRLHARRRALPGGITETIADPAGRQPRGGPGPDGAGVLRGALDGLLAPRRSRTRRSRPSVAPAR